MATITGFTAERMREIEAASIVDGAVLLDNLILTRHDGSTIDAGSVRGPTGSPGISAAEFNAQSKLNSPIGMINDFIGMISPINWLTMFGQTVVDGQNLYPEFWLLLPASMKSGSNIIMPDTRSRVSVGFNSSDSDFDVIGEIGGTKTQILTKAQLPAVTINIDPPVLSINPPAANVYVDPPNTAVSISDPGHIHNSGGGPSYWVTGSQYTMPPAWAPGMGFDGMADSEGKLITNHTTGISATVDIAPFWASCDIPAFDVDQGVFQSGNLGSGEGHNIVQPYVVFLKIIKVL